MMKLCQMVLKGVNCVHNHKTRSYGLERNQLGTQCSNQDHIDLERSQLGTQ